MTWVRAISIAAAPSPASATTNVILKSEHHGEPTTHQSLIIDDGNPYAHWSPMGNRARTRKPPSGRGPAAKVPPGKRIRVGSAHGPKQGLSALVSAVD